MKILVLSGANHGFDQSAPLIAEALNAASAGSADLSEDKELLCSLDGYGAIVFGTGFTRGVPREDGTLDRVPDLSREQEEGLFGFVEQGGGLVGIHGTGWWIPSRAVALIGGHANWHPPGLRFRVEIDDREHKIVAGVDDFEVDDEIYMSAWDPSIHVLASAEWQDMRHPLAWTHSFGEGRVFYTALGHGPGTFESPAVQRMVAQGAKWVCT